MYACRQSINMSIRSVSCGFLLNEFSSSGSRRFLSLLLRLCQLMFINIIIILTILCGFYLTEGVIWQLTSIDFAAFDHVQNEN